MLINNKCFLFHDWTNWTNDGGNKYKRVCKCCGKTQQQIFER